jgi:hypothetical protein
MILKNFIVSFNHYLYISVAWTIITWLNKRTKLIDTIETFIDSIDFIQM